MEPEAEGNTPPTGREIPITFRKWEFNRFSGYGIKEMYEVEKQKPPPDLPLKGEEKKETKKQKINNKLKIKKGNKL